MTESNDGDGVVAPRHHHRLLAPQRDEVQPRVLQRQPDEAEVDGLVGQRGVLVGLADLDDVEPQPREPLGPDPPPLGHRHPGHEADPQRRDGVPAVGGGGVAHPRRLVPESARAVGGGPGIASLGR